MTHELIYTSAERGLRPGSAGYCVVAMSRGIPPALIDALESLSAYNHEVVTADPARAGNPVVLAHYRVAVDYATYHVLTRVADAGLDYSGRGNFLAHHLAAEEGEVPAGFNPAAALAGRGLFMTKWDREPGYVKARPFPEGRFRVGRCDAWRRAAGDAGWAGVLAGDPSRPVTLALPPGADALQLLAEAAALVPPAERRAVTLSTAYQAVGPHAECNWRCVPAGSAGAGGSVIRLGRPLGPPPQGEATEAARAGRPLTPAPAAAPPAPSRVGRRGPPVREHEDEYGPVEPPPPPAGGPSGVKPLLIGMAAGGLIVLLLTAVVVLLRGAEGVTDKPPRAAESDPETRPAGGDSRPVEPPTPAPAAEVHYLQTRPDAGGGFTAHLGELSEPAVYPDDKTGPELAVYDPREARWLRPKAVRNDGAVAVQISGNVSVTLGPDGVLTAGPGAAEVLQDGVLKVRLKGDRAFHFRTARPVRRRVALIRGAAGEYRAVEVGHFTRPIGMGLGGLPFDAAGVPAGPTFPGEARFGLGRTAVVKHAGRHYLLTADPDDEAPQSLKYAGSGPGMTVRLGGDGWVTLNVEGAEAADAPKLVRLDVVRRIQVEPGEILAVTVARLGVGGG